MSMLYIGDLVEKLNCTGSMSYYYMMQGMDFSSRLVNVRNDNEVMGMLKLLNTTRRIDFYLEHHPETQPSSVVIDDIDELFGEVEEEKVGGYDEGSKTEFTDLEDYEDSEIDESEDDILYETHMDRNVECGGLRKDNITNKAVTHEAGVGLTNNQPKDVITSESGYDTGVNSPEGCGLGYEVSQTCAPADLVQVSRFGSSLGFKHHCGVDYNDKAGGLWVGWHDDILLEVCELNTNFIVLQVHDSVRGNWFIIFMYGSPCILARGQVWSSIETKFQNFQKPFIIMGDLNQVRGWAEKLSSHKRFISGALAFNDLIFRNRLVDLPSQGVWYTWCNNRKETKAVYERLDRVLASSSWTALFS
ncbi:hypothetical protein LOK49_LG11G00488 [Camellia lanceoleosa]|uniref:Uncharacterized protein n=1 Tax=Camellia lanceoleosa TaxID=1840588 RepID=A0ACC0G000_9ERIC|nr:hypothetical protein LOK49_LG11G00488 [Camellia lanceoleosa]